MKKFISLLVALVMLVYLAPAAFSVNEDVSGNIMIYTSILNRIF